MLQLEEEPDDEEVMDPRRQGAVRARRVRAVLQRVAGRGPSRDHAGESRRRARDVHRRRRPRARAPAGSRGRRSSARGCSDRRPRPGWARRCCAWKPSGRSPVVERLLEHRLDGEFTIATADGPRTIALRGKADRLDLLADGTFRLIDYKLGWPPDRARALQLPIYSLCAEQQLAGHRGRSWTLGEAVYLAFKGPRRVVPLFSSPADRDEGARRGAAAARRHASTRSTRGEFPPTPDDVYRCETCSFAVGVPEGLRRRRLSRVLPFDATKSTGWRAGLVTTRSGRRPRQPRPSDAAARRDAVDPSRNIVLEASAGTGKTRVLVERYVNLLRAGVEPDHILAITFTRKAAAEMRQRIIERLQGGEPAVASSTPARWRDLKERLGDIAISTIDAFCLSLLREFPLEADVDPGFDLADDTEVPRLIGESLDQALRICRGVARDDDDVALVFAQLGERRLRAGHRGAAGSAARGAARAAALSAERSARSDRRRRRASARPHGCATSSTASATASTRS